MPPSILQPSFAAGELSPLLYARVDLEKYRSGVALARNWFVDYRGGISTRPGSLYVGTCLATPDLRPRLIPFVVSSDAAYALEFGHEYVRFIKDDAYVMDGPDPLEVTSPYAWYDLPLVKFAQSANVLTLTHMDYPVYELRRVDPTSFTLTEKVVGTSILSPANVVVTARNSGGGAYLYAYTVTSVSAEGTESRVTAPALIVGDILDQNAGKVNVVKFDPVAEAVSYNIYKAGPVPSGTGNTSAPVPTLSGFIGNTTTNSFVDNNIAADFSNTPPISTDPFAPGQLARVQPTAPGTGYTVDALVPLIVTGDGFGAAGYAVADRDAGEVVGVVMTSFGYGYTTATVTDAGPNTATYSVTIGQQDGTYPGVVGYFQQRIVFGGTRNFPTSLVLSKTGAFNNFDTSLILQDDDSITVALNSQQANLIKSFTAMPTGLVVFTSGGGFLVSGGSPEAPLTPQTISALPQASTGANDMPPIVINYDVLYCQNRGAVVRDLAFNFYVQSYTGTDRSVLASHLFTGYSLEEWCYAEEPFRLVHVVRSDGRKLLLAYVPEQEIFGWTWEDTNGLYRSVCSIPQGNVNAVYQIVQREVNGVFYYFVERVVDRNFPTVEDSWCLDCALALPTTRPDTTLVLANTTGTNIAASAGVPTFAPGDVGKTIWALGGRANIVGYSDDQNVTVDIVQPFPSRPNSTNPSPNPVMPGEWSLQPNVTTVSGLDHLEGAFVSALCDGRPVANLLVEDGEVTLPEPASKVVVGLPYSGQLQTLGIDLGDPTVQGKRKVIQQLTAIVDKSLGLQTGRDFANLFPVKELVGANFPPTFFSGKVFQGITGAWSEEGQICFQQDFPLPVTILGLVPKVRIGDTSNG